MRKTLFVLISVLCWGGICVSTPAQTQYRFPTVPDTITDSKERTEYVVKHFWENSPSETCLEPQTMETYFYALTKVTFKVRCESVFKLIDDNICNLDRLSVIGFYLDSFVGNPESDYWDDDLYLASQHYIVNCSIPEEYKITPKWRIELFSKTAIGKDAPNVVLKDIYGNTTDLYHQKMPCLLIFANSECERCKNEQSLYSTEIKEAHKMGWNTITVYLDGVIPPHASTSAFADIDNHIIDDNVYVVRRLPSVYLIDSNKKIVARELKLSDAIKWK